MLIDRKISGLKSDYVLVDNHLGGCLAGRHFIELGHRNIGYIDRLYPHYHSFKGRKGFERA